MQVKIFHALCRRRSDRSNVRTANLTSIIVQLEKDIEERFDAVRACEHNPVIPVCVLHQLREFA